MIDKQKHREFKKIVDRILWEEWDPIGVNRSSGAADEYTKYAGGICGKLWEGASREELLDYLYWIENDHMGLSIPKAQADLKNGPLVDRMRTVFGRYK